MSDKEISYAYGTEPVVCTIPSVQEDDDAKLVASVAEEFVDRLGRDAVPYLRLEEALAMDKGDVLSAEAWHDIADAAVLALACVNRPSSHCTKLRVPPPLRL